ncbi:MAG: transcription antitermination factor NusB [Deltaproteobacteria bacterium]|nr:transcription antitermination factor NusB [Deltaproteobacteria bacterium]
MGARTAGREAALQMLFAADVTSAPPAELVRSYWRETPGDAEGRPYSEQLVRDVLAERETLDRAISAASDHWRIDRMTRVDRNVLRLGAWELLHDRETPAEVVLDEAVELAKRYGTEGSGAFVNGVLARLAADAGRAVTRPSG